MSLYLSHSYHDFALMKEPKYNILKFKVKLKYIPVSNLKKKGIKYLVNC